MGESGKEFKMSDCPVAKIRGIQFGLMSDKEIVNKNYYLKGKKIKLKTIDPPNNYSKIF
jgi:hypothetical protein